ncbi:MAG: transposase [Acetobacteraceae bacterium]|nr:transposase [Acetobacteraceae bacterium]
MPVSLPPHTLTPRPWRPLTDREWAELRVWLPHGDPDMPHRGPGRPPRDLRRTVDAIFWVAASHGPWKALPPELGKPGTAHRTLARWARAGVLEPLLVKVSHPDADGSPTLRALAWWLAKAFRRMARIVSTAALALVRDVLGLIDAWPANPLRLPDRNLSKSAKASLRTVGKALKLNTMLLVRAARAEDQSQRAAREAMHRTISRTLRAGWRQLRLGLCGNRHQWRLK